LTTRYLRSVSISGSAGLVHFADMTASLRRRGLRSAALAAALVIATACSDDGGTVAPTSTVAARTPTTEAADDGILRIGVLLPRSGAGGPLGEPLMQAVDLAVAEINADGGVNGTPVELVIADEGDAIATAAKGAAELLEAKVDAVVGPASSRIALGVLGSFVDEGVFTCSPTATAIALSDFPDDRFFVRTIPSDALQAVAMAELIEGAGVSSAAVMAPDDDFGRPYADALAGSLTRRGITVNAQVLYGASDGGYDSAVAQALLTTPGAIALVGNAVNGRQMLAAVDRIVPEGLPVVVNDALRRATAVDANPPVAANADIAGTSPRAAPAQYATWFSPAFASFLGVAVSDAMASFAANAYDCVNLIAIAAEAAGANAAVPIADNVRDVSSGGASCGNFPTCRLFLDEGRNIDLNGASGPLELDVEGDVSVGLFDRFRFDESGRDIPVGEVQVSAN